MKRMGNTKNKTPLGGDDIHIVSLMVHLFGYIFFSPFIVCVKGMQYFVLIFTKFLCEENFKKNLVEEYKDKCNGIPFILLTVSI